MGQLGWVAGLGLTDSAIRLDTFRSGSARTRLFGLSDVRKPSLLDDVMLYHVNEQPKSCAGSC